MVVGILHDYGGGGGIQDDVPTAGVAEETKIESPGERRGKQKK